MNSIILSVVLVFVAANHLAVTEGLECYTCWAVASYPDDLYPETPVEGVKGHPSCNRGLLPDESLKVTCPTMKDDEDNEIKPVCTQLYLDSVISVPELPELPPVDVKATVRGCFYADSSVEDLSKKEDGCYSKKYEELVSLSLGPFKQLLEEGKGRFPSDVSGELCHCKTDNCNSFDVCNSDSPPEYCHDYTAAPTTTDQSGGSTDAKEATTEQSGGGSSSPTECTGDKCGLAPTISGKLSLLTILVALSLAFYQGLF